MTKDAQFFFGRETFTDMLVDAVQNQPLLDIKIGFGELALALTVR
jgi:hypothetical protein